MRRRWAARASPGSEARRTRSQPLGDDGWVTDEIGAQLVGWGKVALLETRGRQSGTLFQTAVGFVHDGDNLFVAAGEPDADWALNLRVTPHCWVTIGDDTAQYVAHELDEATQHAAVSALILKYGTPAERLGRGPAFRLLPEQPARFLTRSMT